MAGEANAPGPGCQYPEHLIAELADYHPPGLTPMHHNATNSRDSRACRSAVLYFARGVELCATVIGKAAGHQGEWHRAFAGESIPLPYWRPVYAETGSIANDARAILALRGEAPEMVPAAMAILGLTRALAAALAAARDRIALPSPAAGQLSEALLVSAAFERSWASDAAAPGQCAATWLGTLLEARGTLALTGDAAHLSSPASAVALPSDPAGAVTWLVGEVLGRLPAIRNTARARWALPAPALTPALACRPPATYSNSCVVG